MPDISWPDVLSRLIRGGSLEPAETSWAMEQIMEGEAGPAQFGAFVAALRAKGESVEEIQGLVSTMRRYSLKVPIEGKVVDTCGTGGDRSGTVNISTIAAFVAAGAGVKVAKHGNRAASSACGSADLLEALGVKIDLSPEQVAECITQAGIGFCFAPVFHPSMRHAAGSRRELGIPTVFNFLGPLTSPAGARHQVVGVSDPAMAPKMAEVLGRLGAEHALVVHGMDGLDEITTTAATHVWEVRDGGVSTWTLDPASFGIERADLSALKGGTTDQNVAAARSVLSGQPSPIRDVVVVNAAAALVAIDAEDGFESAIAAAEASIDSGRASAALNKMIEVSVRGA